MLVAAVLLVAVAVSVAAGVGIGKMAESALAKLQQRRATRRIVTPV